MSQILVVKKIKDIAILRLNRPEKRNALSPELVDELQKQLSSIRENSKIRAVIITGTGKAFCAGADLAYLQEMSTYSDRRNLADSQKLAELFKLLYELPKLTIAQVNGPALAGGFGLALCCDYLFADVARAQFGFTETRIGFLPAIVMNILIRKLPLNLARHLVLSAEILTTKDALNSGIADFGFTGEELASGTLSFLEKLLAQNSFQAMLQTKKLFHQLLDLPLAEGLRLSAEVNAESRKTEECKKGLQAFLNKQKLIWRD